MRGALILGSIGAVIMASPKKRRGSGGGRVDPLADVHRPAPGALFMPVQSTAIDDGGPYCLVATVLSICAGELCRSGRITERKRDSLPKNKSFRKQLCNLIISSPFNDVLYGEAPMPGSNVACGPLGTTISVRRKHADNLSRVAQGRTLVRTIDRRGRIVSPSEGHHFPLMWIPYICLDSLVQGHVTTGSYEYEDGSSTIVPPPPIMGLL